MPMPDSEQFADTIVATKFGEIMDSIPEEYRRYVADIRHIYKGVSNITNQVAKLNFPDDYTQRRTMLYRFWVFVAMEDLLCMISAYEDSSKAKETLNLLSEVITPFLTLIDKESTPHA